ncbi:hypothetical protein SLEP1_g30201 [Rubroshorea leprosula]|uniref:BHLH domain-containing protein n=1 Tax=Rubroshorea leprosula TaxID=152421 RepID=A0AAV5K8S0_9ROSI|nr:hypothetical protein SLEP1_g30201 [Rubroshorea leprosula]
MGSGGNDDVGFQHRYENMNYPSSQMNKGSLSDKVGVMAMSSMSMYKPSNGADPFVGSGWVSNPMASLSQSENFGGSSMVSQGEFPNSHYSAMMENQGIAGASHFSQYPSHSSFMELMPKHQCFGSGNFSEIVGSFGVPHSTQILNSGIPPDYVPNLQEGGLERASANGTQPNDDRQVSEEGAICASPNEKKRKRVTESNPTMNSSKDVAEEPQKNLAGDCSDAPKEQDGKKLKIGQNNGANSRGKQVVKQAKDSSQSGEATKENYIHVRARRGQATNSHSLAERVRREKISERMRLLQELVPGCNKITGKAVMLDEIINYVQSLQQQVEFLSMKLATVNPELNIDLERLLSKDILHSQGASAAFLGFGPGLNFSHPYPPGVLPGTISGIPSTGPPFPSLPQAALDNELHNLFQTGFDPSSAMDSLGPHAGRMKSDL